MTSIIRAAARASKATRRTHRPHHRQSKRQAQPHSTLDPHPPPPTLHSPLLPAPLLRASLPFLHDENPPFPPLAFRPSRAYPPSPSPSHPVPPRRNALRFRLRPKLPPLATPFPRLFPFLVLPLVLFPYACLLAPCELFFQPPPSVLPGFQVKCDLTYALQTQIIRSLGPITLKNEPRTKGIGRFGTPRTVSRFELHGNTVPESRLPVSCSKAVGDASLHEHNEPGSCSCLNSCSNSSSGVSLKSLRPLLELLIKQKEESAAPSAIVTTRGIGRFGKPNHVTSMKSLRANRPLCFKPPQPSVRIDSTKRLTEDHCNSIVLKSVRPLLENLSRQPHTSPSFTSSAAGQSVRLGDVKPGGIGRFRGQVAAFEVTAAASSHISASAAPSVVPSPAVVVVPPAASAAEPDPSAAAAMLESTGAESERPLLQYQVKVARNDCTSGKDGVPASNTRSISGSKPISSTSSSSSSSSKERVLLLRTIRSIVHDLVRERTDPANHMADSHRSTRRHLKETLLQLALQRVKASHSCEFGGQRSDSVEGGCGQGYHSK
ncbi:unnamed protein product [Closterium sp. NIES-54]